MIKKILFSLSLLIGISCVPVQTAEGSSAWDVTKNGAKIAGGSLLILWGANTIYQSLSPKARKKARKEFEKARIEQRKIVELKGGDVNRYDAMMDQIAEGMKSVPLILIGAILGAGITTFGVSLIYKGYNGFTAQREVI